ncbi:predicted protein [Histoplasma capsulatum H143]|uniref:Uncharacterized protein n=1 Tax=Ajellomyces capsulatus (strain H143) TaxID=544712 RepID=C6HHR5_AJECH|nr:predicted protein [Histoplasma capsulatum H143]
MAWIVSSRYRQVVRANASTKHTTALPVSLCMPHSDVRACAIAERGLTCLASPHPQQLQAASQMGLRQAPYVVSFLLRRGILLKWGNYLESRPGVGSLNP